MRTPNPEKDSPLGQTIPIQKPLTIFEITGIVARPVSAVIYAQFISNLKFLAWLPYRDRYRKCWEGQLNEFHNFSLVNKSIGVKAQEHLL